MSQLNDARIRSLLMAWQDIEGCDCQPTQAFKLIKDGEMPEWLRRILEIDQRIILHPFPLETELTTRIGPCSLDFPLGTQIAERVSSQNLQLLADRYLPEAIGLDEVGAKVPLRTIDITTNSFVLMPGKFILAQTREVIFLPNNLVGHATSRSRHGRLGITSVGSPKIDPGYYGPITLEIVNHGPDPIVIETDAIACQMEFGLLIEPAKVAYYDRRSGGTYGGGKL